MTEKDKALEVYDKLFEATESFEPIAIFVCYLIPAILRNENTYVDINMGYKDERDFYELLCKVFDKDHFVWDYIKIYQSN
jgi:hypothetical protein